MEEIFTNCPHCPVKIGPLNESDKGIIAKGGEISHFECAYKYINGHDWVEPEWLKKINKTD